MRDLALAVINTGGVKPTDISKGNVDSVVQSLLQNFANLAFFVLGFVAVVFIIIGGIQLTTSAGSPDGLKKAKKTITLAILGLIIALMAGAIKTFIWNL